VLQKPTLHSLWHVALRAEDIARRLGEARDAVAAALKTPTKRERIRRRLAERLGVPADRLEIRSGGVLVGEVWLEVPVARGWIAASRLVLQAGRLVVAEVRVFPDEATAFRQERGGQWSGDVLGVRSDVPPGGLTARVLRAVRLGEHPRHVRDILRFLEEKYGPDAFKAGGSLAALGLVPDTERPRRRREVGRPDAFFAELAADYVRRIERGSAKPNAEIATARGWDAKTITGWLHEARTRGLLTSPGYGRPGGRLTPYGERVLREAARATMRRRGRPGKARDREARQTMTKRRERR
jgi:hypothetical protein